MTGSKGELILYFKSNLKAWDGKLRGNSAARVLFYRSEARSTKIVFVGRNFSVELSLATYRVRVHE